MFFIGFLVDQCCDVMGAITVEIEKNCGMSVFWGERCQIPYFLGPAVGICFGCVLWSKPVGVSGKVVVLILSPEC